MKPPTKDIFKQLKEETTGELDEKVKQFNVCLTKEKAFALELGEVKNEELRIITNPVKLKQIERLIKVLDATPHDLDYEDYIKFAINDIGKNKHEVFPPLDKIIKRHKKWKAIKEDTEIIRHLFWPTSTERGKHIYDPIRETYYGFHVSLFDERVEKSGRFLLFKEEVFIPWMDGKLAEITRFQLQNTELVLTNMLRYRERYKKDIPTIYKLWKEICKIKVVEFVYRPHKGEKDDQLYPL